MNYCLEGHDYRHAVEEMLFHLFPAETTNQTGFCCSKLMRTKDGVRATAYVTLGEKTNEAIYETKIANDNALDCRRKESEAVRLSVYNAAVPLLAQPPEWGSLTGVRPAKLTRAILERGATPAEAAKELRERFSVSAERANLAVCTAQVALDFKRKLSPKDVSLYVGIPFCPSRCAYCSFVSASVDRAGALIAPYMDALCAEIEMTGRLLREGDWRVISIYIGGGTPTTLTAEQLDRLMSVLHSNIDCKALQEFTVEAGRPDTITEEKLHVIQAGGATRISINPQTMNDVVLAHIGRRHNAAQVLEAYALAQKVGFDAINMDVIAGLEGDTTKSFFSTMETLIALNPENITVHTLAIKRAADLCDKMENANKRELVGEMLRGANQMLENAGYTPYYLYRQKFTAGGFENVGWCKPRTENLYNICMMEELQTIVSLGAGAISKKVTNSGRITRYANPKYPTEYLAAGAKITQARHELLALDKPKKEMPI